MALLAPASRAARRFRSLVARPRLDDEIAGELAFHLEMLERDYAARGLSPAAAAAAARRRFGDVARVRAACAIAGAGRDRGRRLLAWAAEMGRDLRFAARRLGEGGGSVWLAVAALALGLGGAAIAWRIEQAVLRPPAVAEPATLVRLRQLSPHGDALAASVADFLDWRRLSRGFLGMAAFDRAEVNLVARVGDGAAAAERVAAARATPSLLPVLGLRPLLGRGFGVGEAAHGGDHRVALLSHDLWLRRFGGDPRVVGTAVQVDGRELRVIGVMPAGLVVPSGIDLWLPLAVNGPLHGVTREHHRLEVLARLRPEVTRAAAAVDLAAAAAAVGRQLPAARRGWGVEVEALPAAWAGERWPARARLLLAAGALLWLLASGSAANLLWARAAARQRELDVRAALGGGRGRIVRQLLAEALLVAALGATFGLLVAGAASTVLRHSAAGLPRLAAALGGEMDRPAAGGGEAEHGGALSGGESGDGAPSGGALWEGAPSGGVLGDGARSGGAAEGGLAALLPRLDAASAAVVLGLALLSALLCTLGPALQALRPGPVQAVRQSARLTTAAERRWRDALVVAQLAAATTLLIGAGLLLASYRRLAHAAPGFDADHLVTMRLALNGARYPPAARRALAARLEEGLAALPGVAAAGLVSTAPLATDGLAEPFTLGGASAAGCREALAAEWRVVTPGAFTALGLRRVAGRLLGPADRDAAHPAVVVDATLAARCWPGSSPLGRHLQWPAAGRDLVVVGVVAALSDVDLEAGPRPVLLLPYAALPWRAMAVVVRPSGRDPGLPGAVRRQVAALDPALPLAPPRFLAAARRQALAAPLLGSWMVALFALGALALAASGVTATAAAAVARRTPEIAVRQALGAAPRGVVGLILRRGAALVACGSLLGIGGGLLFSRLLAGLLYPAAGAAGARGAIGAPGLLETAAIHAGAALLLAGVALVATAVPARRAAAIAPVLALRGE
jgi:putative ABC transport system permease protein